MASTATTAQPDTLTIHFSITKQHKANMDHERKEEIATGLEQYLANKGMSTNQFGREHKDILTTAYVSIILNRKWDEQRPGPDTWRKLERFLGLRKDAYPFVRTTNYIKIEQVFADACDNQRMIAVAGYTGAGKTSALRRVVRENAHTYYVEGDGLMTKKAFTVSLCLSMGIDIEGTIRERLTAVADRMRNVTSSGNKPVIIIDNAHKLRDDVLLMLETLYCLTEYDPSNRFCGIVISGTDVLKAHIDKMARRDKGAFREFRRRIGYWQRMYRPSQKIIAEIAGYCGITDKSALTYLVQYADDYGTLRSLIANALRAQENTQSQITGELLSKTNVGDQDYKAA